MLLQFLLYALCLVNSAVALALPSQAQIPLLSSQQQAYTRIEHLSVLMAYRRHGEDYEATVQIPLRQPLRGSILHGGLASRAHKLVDSLKIVAVQNGDSASSGSLEALSRVRCSVKAQFSTEEASAAAASGGEPDAWPSFGVEDGAVALNQSKSRWFLAGRSIESIECW